MLSLLFTLFSIVYSQNIDYVTLIDINVDKYADPYDNIYTQSYAICAFKDTLYNGCHQDRNTPSSVNGRNINIIVKVDMVSIDSFVYNYMRTTDGNRNHRDYDMWFNILIMSIKSIDKYTGFGNGNLYRQYVLKDNMQLLSYMTEADAFIVNASIAYVDKIAIH
jgi:hypothetical protein